MMKQPSQIGLSPLQLGLQTQALLLKLCQLALQPGPIDSKFADLALGIRCQWMGHSLCNRVGVGLKAALVATKPEPCCVCRPNDRASAGITALAHDQSLVAVPPLSQTCPALVQLGFA